jgi:hypothetical protein
MWMPEPTISTDAIILATGKNWSVALSPGAIYFIQITFSTPCTDGPNFIFTLEPA